MIDASVTGADEESRRPTLMDAILKELKQKNKQPDGDILIAHKDSDTAAIYNPSDKWLFSTETVKGVDEPPEIIMRRPLNGLRWPCKNPENVMPEAYADDGVNCVIRQLCALYKLDQQ